MKKQYFFRDFNNALNLFKEHIVLYLYLELLNLIIDPFGERIVMQFGGRKAPYFIMIYIIKPYYDFSR
jgi:hypothetical protein